MSTPGKKGKFKTPEEFWSDADVKDLYQCWDWKREKKKGSGYGRAWMFGRRMQAHRVALKLMFGIEVPDGMQVDHRCKRRSCVNPYHLDVVTPQENQRRSNSVSGLNMKKTHCHNGHPLSGENLHIIQRSFDAVRTGTNRSCRICARAASARCNAKKAAARAVAV